MTTALILAGHGSHISPNTAGIVWEMVDELRRLNVADEVTACFWKEFPSFHQVLNTITADEIIVVPVFTARGYFTQTVIPAEMDLSRVRYTATLGEHPDLKEVALRRVQQTISEHNLDPQQTAVAVIGHGTKRNSESRITTQAQADVIRQTGLAAEVVAVFLDDDPDIPDIYPMTSAPNIIAVPYFLAFGSHTTIDVPGKLGLDSGATFGQVNGRDVYYTAPVGADSGLCDVVLKLAGLAPREPASVWDNFPSAGRVELAKALESGEWCFGELAIQSPSLNPFPEHRGGTFKTSGEAHVSPLPMFGVGGKGVGICTLSPRHDDTPDPVTLTTPKQLREWVRGGDDHYRPLPTAYGLPRGWRIEAGTVEKVHAVIETVYPGALADWAAGELEVNTLEQVTARHTGMLRDLNTLSRATQAELVETICGGCVRHATWFDGERGAIPCPEPCNFWMSQAKEHVQ